MKFCGPIEQVLRAVSWSNEMARLGCAYIVPVGAAHHQRPFTLEGAVGQVAITSDVLEGVTASPLSCASSFVAGEMVALVKVVPGAKEFD